MKMKKLLIFILCAICLVGLVGCDNKKEIETSLKDTAELHGENVNLSEKKVTDVYEPVNEQEIIEKQEDIVRQDDMFEEDEDEQQDVVRNNSYIQIKNFLKDGTFWGIETDETGEVYTIHADVLGNILKRVSTGGMGKEIRYGIGDSFVIWESEYPCRIYDLDTNRDATTDFIGDYDVTRHFIVDGKSILFSTV